MQTAKDCIDVDLYYRWDVCDCIHHGRGMILTELSVCIISILRLQSLVEISNSADPTYDNPSAATWSSVEINVGIICSCLPLLRPLLIRWLPSTFSVAKYSDGSTPRVYATIGSARCRDVLNSQSGFALRSTQSTLSNGLNTRKDKDIQVVTQVFVEVKEGKRKYHSGALENRVEKGRKSLEGKLHDNSSRRQSWLSAPSTDNTLYKSGTDKLANEV